MMAISIRQPWAWAILHGGKDVENRVWPTKYRGSILIHAAKRYEPDDEEFVARTAYETASVSFPGRDALRCGGIVGAAYLARCVTDMDSPWFFGPFGFELTCARPLPFFATPGRLGLFRVADRPEWNCRTAVQP